MGDAKDRNHAAYLAYTGALRAWFVGFGVGGPALIYANDYVREAVVNKGALKEITTLFLVGALLQIGIALLNKYVNWRVYKPTNGNNGCLEGLKDRIEIDMACDWATVIVYGFAIVCLLFIV